jgi:succinate dehydrogenase / fumarate reductase cytochrome b subunit
LIPIHSSALLGAIGAFMPSRVFSSSIGSKLLIALTGIGLFLFLVLHLSGNLLFIVGPAPFNEYSHKLVSNPLVYLVEAGLVAIFLLHVYKTLRLYTNAKVARPVAYARKEWAGSPSRKSVASSTMILSGLIMFGFVVLHLRKFKFGPWYQTPDGIRDLYRLQLEIFSHPVYVVFYMISMVVIGFHLWHGVSSAAQSLGLDHPKYTPKILWIGRVLAILIAGGFFILPLYTYLMGARS